MALQLARRQGHSETFGQPQTEAFKQYGLRAIGTNDTAQSQLATGSSRGRQNDVGAGDGGELLEHGAWGVAKAGAALPLLQRLPQHIGKEAHQDVRQHAILTLVPDRADRQLAFIDTERRFDIP